MDILPTVGDVLYEIDLELSKEKTFLEGHCDVLGSFDEPAQRVNKKTLKPKGQHVLKAGYEPKKLKLSVKNKQIEYKGIDELLDRVVTLEEGQEDDEETTKLQQVKREGATEEMMNGICLVNNYIQTRKTQIKKEDNLTRIMSQKYEDLFQQDMKNFFSNEEKTDILKNIEHYSAKKTSVPVLPERPQKDICDPKRLKSAFNKRCEDIQQRINCAILADIPKNVPHKLLPSIFRVVNALQNINKLQMPLLVKEQY
ncbi:uncharacterized protein LOC106670974 [Cimex lectularius]|uniref:Uncharacterized protein n=1 Tax=Cimex lectularius TaxID=79782 RepID=A0A8I6TJV3_CIMLE|nr:uncharacterized protein LOC106670974 [Cimex lectularius]